MHNKKFPASLDHLYEMMNFIQHFAYKQGFDDNLSNKILLAAEEALVNVICHGYPDEKEQGELEIQCEECATKPGIKILIKDQGVGIPFDPVQEAHKRRQDKICESSSSDRELIGGYGVMIYVGLMDRVEYYRTNEGNLLFLIKYL
jgi:serine/threonine-protein kinase RsbW